MTPAFFCRLLFPVITISISDIYSFPIKLYLVSYMIELGLPCATCTLPECTHIQVAFSALKLLWFERIF